MQFELPGQFRGPECRRLISSLRLLRSRLEPWFASLENAPASKIAVVLRIDGSLGTFGAPGIENVHHCRGVLSCDLVISDHDWATLADDRVFAILSNQVIDAIVRCLASVGISARHDDLRTLANGA
jgi:hypothetical protein